VDPSIDAFTLPAPDRVLPECYNLADMARITRVSEKTVKKLVARGLLPRPAVREGKIWIWTRESWERWVANTIKRM
jgi:hypothetical protein